MSTTNAGGSARPMPYPRGEAAQAASASGSGRKFRKRHPLAFGVGAVFGFLALGAGVAWALFTLMAGVTGSVSSNQSAAYFGSPSASSPNGDATCSVATTGTTITLAGDGSTAYSGLVITMKNAYPGSSCTFSAKLTASGSSEAMNVKGVTLNGLPTGWTATLAPSSCGLVVPMSQTLSASPVTFTVTMGATAVPGSSGTITASGSGIALVPASQWVAPNNTCPAS